MLAQFVSVFDNEWIGGGSPERMMDGSVADA